MFQPNIAVWFVCRLCRGSFGQVDAFIEHKKQKHFNQFQKTNCIIFEESEQGQLYPIITSNGDHQIADEISDPLIKTEVTDGDPVIPFSSEIIEEPNLYLVQVKSELITYESEIISDSENNFFDLKEPQQNPYVLLKRLTSKEIRNACAPQQQHRSSLLKCEQKNLKKRPQPRCSLDTSIKIIDHNQVEKCTGIQPTGNAIISTEDDLQSECKLCSKQLQSDAQLKIHVGICALYHKDRNRFCVSCNRKFSRTDSLKEHRLRIHGTEEEKSNLFKFKCHVCRQQFCQVAHLRLHLQSPKKKKQVKTSKSKPVKCSHLNCEREFRWNSELQRHVATAHLGVRAFSCDFPNCNKTFSYKGSFNVHLRIHTGERPFKCTVDNCNKAFITSRHRSVHHQSVHFNL